MTPVEAGTLEARKLDMPCANFVMLNGKVFSLDEVGQVSSAEAVLKAFYSHNYEQAKSALYLEERNSLYEDFNRQLGHVERINTAGNIAIREEDFDKPVCYYHGRYLKCRSILYKPRKVIGEYYRFKNALSAEFIKDRINFPVTDSMQLILHVKQDFCVFPLLLGFDLHSNTMFTINCRTFHAFDGGKVCTGSHDAKGYFKLSTLQLDDAMNTINTFSPATETLRLMNMETGGDYRVHMKDFIKQELITSIEKGGKGTWKVK